MPDASTRDPRLPYTEIDDDFLPPRDPELGYVKIGGKSSTVRYTQAGKPWVAPTRFLDPARFEVTTREKIGKNTKGKPGTAHAKEDFTVDLGYARDEAFHQLEGVGPAPSSLRVRLIYPRWNKNLIAFLGAYGGGEWVCRGNGVEAIDVKRGACACPCPRLKQFSGKYQGTQPNDGRKYKDDDGNWKRDGVYPCKPHAQLNVILEEARLFGGFWPFKTTSFETISNLTKSLRMFEEMFKRVDGLPLELRVMAVTKQLPGGGTTVQPIVTLVLPAAMSTARQLAADAAAESRKFLPAGRKLDEEVYREAVISGMEEEATSYADEFLPVEVVVEEEDGGAPVGALSMEHEHAVAAESQVADEVEEPTRERAPESDDRRDDPGDERDDPEDGRDDSDRNDPEQLARDVLEATGSWNSEAIDDRVSYHVKTGTLDKLLERLERGEPEAWAKVATGNEPDDGLPF